jgi:hypothetical protein
VLVVLLVEVIVPVAVDVAVSVPVAVLDNVLVPEIVPLAVTVPVADELRVSVAVPVAIDDAENVRAVAIIFTKYPAPPTASLHQYTSPVVVIAAPFHPPLRPAASCLSHVLEPRGSL